MMSLFGKLRNIVNLLKEVDFDKLTALNEKVDLSKAMDSLGQLDERQLKRLLKIVQAKGEKDHHQLPPIDADFYNLSSKLTAEQRELQLKVRDFMEKEIKPYVNTSWYKAEFPFAIIDKFKDLNLAGMPYKGYGCPNLSHVMEGVLTQEMARVDASITTFFGVHSGLAMGSIYLLGSTQQKEEWLPEMQKMEKIGAFGLTEPDVGSAISQGMKTSCEFDGERWILHGQKKWIGNATFADLTIIWARDVDSHKVKGFIVRKENPGFKAERIKGKMALRTVQNALVTLDHCKIPESDRLQKAHSFRDTAKVLRMTRAGVAWIAVGLSRGAYEGALKYTKKRKQFGRSIASYQLIQNHLVEMLSNLTAMQTLVYRLSEMQDEGVLADEHASLAKVHCTLRMRDIVSRAREVMGGNGILLEHDVARFVADAEAIYSYEGTKEINTMIVGRAITGYSAFVN